MHMHMHCARMFFTCSQDHDKRDWIRTMRGLFDELEFVGWYADFFAACSDVSRIRLCVDEQYGQQGRLCLCLCRCLWTWPNDQSCDWAIRPNAC